MGFDLDDDPIDKIETPFCRKHYCAMGRYKTTKEGKRYYRCKVKGCTERASVSPKAIKLPTEPTKCAICQSAMEVEKIGSFFIVMKCPGVFDGGLECGHRIEFARPDIDQRIKKIARKSDILDL